MTVQPQMGPFLIKSEPWLWLRQQMPVTQRWAYLDHAAVAPLSLPAQSRMTAFAQEAAQDGTTVWPQWSQGVEVFRENLAQWINASATEIAMIPNTSYGINIVAEGYPWKQGDNIVTFEGEFPSNRFPWENQQTKGVQVRTVPCPGGEVSMDRIAQSIDQHTRIVAISWVGYASGFRVDLNALTQLVHDRGALLFVDAIQGMGVYPLDVQATPIDFLAADGHKWMLGPEGAGFAYIRAEHLNRLRCINVGWHSVRNSADFKNAKLDLRDEAARFEAGSANMVGLLSMAESVNLFTEIIRHHGPNAISQRVLELTALAIDRLCDAGASVATNWDSPNRSSIIVFTVPNMTPAAIRSMALKHDVVVSCRGGGVRVSIHAYNTESDVDRLIDVVRLCQQA
ncbi:MAG: aminotransferase class V-fold PLP-dependent enzyme [Pirellulaceae bacterium]